MALNAYTNEVKSLLHDFSLQFYGSPFDMTGAINIARKRVAAEAQCIRVLPAAAGPISLATVVNGGSGYLTPPTITVGGNGSGAILTAVLTGGVVTSITITNGGQGYAPPLSLSFSSTSGSGASATATVTGILTTTANKEVYTYTDASVVAMLQSGVGPIQGVLSVAVNQGAQKPILRHWPWSTLQAYARSYSAQTTNYPYVWAQYAQGTSGSMYLYPIPSDTFSMEWDCYCLPIDLVDDTTPESIPYPWTTPVAYYTAYLAYQNAQRNDDADRMKTQYREKMMEAGGFARPGVIPNYYGRR